MLFGMRSSQHTALAKSSLGIASTNQALYFRMRHDKRVCGQIGLCHSCICEDEARGLSHLIDVMKQFGLIGYPLGHSFSVDFFTQLFEQSGIEACYKAYELERIDLVQHLLANLENLVGLNVTSPYKETILPFATDLSPEVEVVRAANVLHLRRDGSRVSIKAYNTDIIGFGQSLTSEAITSTDYPRALILGTGGAARAVAYALDLKGVETMLVSREPRVGQVSYDVLDRLLTDYPLVVNATPVGLYRGQIIDIPYHLLTDKHLCYDLIYNPSETNFLAKARAAGARIKNGLEMLHLQALAAWEIWQTP